MATTDEETQRPQPQRPRRRRARRRTEGDRRLWSAGHALVVSVLALALAALLNAPGVHKSASNQPPGVKRDIALAFTGPLETVSHALLLDRPRAGVQRLIGRSGIDEIDTEIGLADVDDGTSVVQPVPPAGPRGRPRFTPSKPLRLLIAGDSLVIEPGFAIQRAIAENRAIARTPDIEGQVASGLTRPDIFNWFQEIRSQLRTAKPHALVLAFGANDTHDYMTGLPEGVTLGSFGGPDWIREYRRRVAGIFNMARRAGAHVVWLGLPSTTDSNQTRSFEVVNAAVAAEARERPDAVSFVDTYVLLAGSNGGYTEYLATPSGGQIKVRGADGVHLERAGADIIAREVLEALGDAFDLRPGR